MYIHTTAKLTEMRGPYENGKKDNQDFAAIRSKPLAKADNVTGYVKAI
jgi:hypothetical protein